MSNKFIIISLLIIIFSIGFVFATSDDNITGDDISSFNNDTNKTSADTSGFTNNSASNAGFLPIRDENSGVIYPYSEGDLFVYPKIENGKLVHDVVAYYKLFDDGGYEIVKEVYVGNKTQDNTTNFNNGTNTNSTFGDMENMSYKDVSQNSTNRKYDENIKTGTPVIVLILATLFSIVCIKRKN